MWLIPPLNTILTLDACQDALNRHLPNTTSWEAAANLLLDKPTLSICLFLHQVLINIPSTAYEGASVFDTIEG
jgi:hypothetical protein